MRGIPCFREQPHSTLCGEALLPHCPLTVSTQMPQKSYPEVEAAVSRLINLHLRASSTYLSRSSCFEGDEVALEAVGRLAEEPMRAPSFS